MLADQHALVDAKACLEMLNDDVHRVDDTRPILGELETARDVAGLDIRLVAFLESSGIFKSANVRSSKLGEHLEVTSAWKAMLDP